MKTNSYKLIALAIVPAAVLVCSSCSSTSPPPPPAGGSTASFEEGVPGGAIVDTYRVTAAVSAIDYKERKATLLTSDGTEVAYTAGPGAINFDQIKVGDHVKATITEQLVVYAREKGDLGQPRNDGSRGVVALAPKGAKPGVVMADTVEVTAQVKSVDLARHKATLEFPNGRTKTVQVRPDVKLSSSDVGREIVIQATQAIAVNVEKP